MGLPFEFLKQQLFQKAAAVLFEKPSTKSSIKFLSLWHKK